MNKEKPKRIVIHGCYSALNSDLGIRDRKGNLMQGEHDVFVVKISNDGKRVKVKTITSLENIRKDGTRSFHAQSLDAVRNGDIIPIPIKKLNSTKLSGINIKGFWISKSKLRKPKRNFKYPSEYNNIIK